MALLEERNRPGTGPNPRARWELYRLLAEPVRPRLLALASLEELGVGELAELLREGQPKISRHASALRDAGLLTARRQGTWTLLRLAPRAADDAVVADAVRAGRTSCELDGTLGRLDDVIEARGAATREFFARGGRPQRSGPPAELAAYLSVFGLLLPRARLAVDIGTGDGALLEVLAPVFDRVVAIDRSAEQLDLARSRIRRRGFNNVELLQGEVDGPEVRRAAMRAVRKEAHDGAGAAAGADVVFAARVLHHAPAPGKALRALAELARPGVGGHGGAVCVLDYEAHDDATLRDEADVWLGFAPDELRAMAGDAGLVDVRVRRLPAAWNGEGPDRHLPWQMLVGWKSIDSAAKAQTREKQEDKTRDA